MTSDADLARRSAARVADLGAAMSEQRVELTKLLHHALADAIEPLQGDGVLLELLYASIESNIETLSKILRYELPVADASAPTAAVEYARRLAQRGISSTALIRAYRLGQQLVVDWAFEEFNRVEPDRAVALAAGRQYTDITFRYIDAISEQVVHEYEAERERWLAHRNTVRAAVIEELVGGGHANVAAAEHALGYRLRQRHLGVVLWADEGDSVTTDLPQLEAALGSLCKALGVTGQSLFFPRERSLAWGWIPLGRGEVPDPRILVGAIDGLVAGLHVAVGTPAADADGFRVTHLEAMRARRVAMVAEGRAQRVTSYVDAEVRTAAMLAVDPESTRRLVAKALGSLALDNEGAERLRDTLLTFLTEKGSYTATSERVHLHKNTIKYRIDRAIEERGRPLDEERLELELALVACRWLGSSVLRAE